MDRDTYRKYYLLYTALFSAVIFAVYGYFWFYGKSFVDCGQAFGDGLVQHYQALCYYARWLREIARTLLTEHRLVIPEWSFSIGYGSDIITTLHYYVIGDPFNLFSALAPICYMPYYYTFMILLRMYFAGLAFSALCFYTADDRKNGAAVLAGAMVYVFGMYGMRSGITHPYFINPMIYFPLLLLGVEKILRGSNPLLFIFTVCVSACSNFYFFYMLALLTALYTFLRLAQKYGNRAIKSAVRMLLRITVYAVIGLASAMAIFLPVMLNVWNDSRFGGGSLRKLLYPVSFYTRLPATFLTAGTSGSWTYLGFAGIGLVALLCLFLQKKQYVFLKRLFVVLSIFMLLPAAGYALNGFAYASNRWNWAFALLVAYIVTAMWRRLLHLTAHEKKWIFIGLCLWSLACLLLDNARTENLAFCLVCTFAAFGALQMGRAEKRRWFLRRECLLLAVVVVNIGVNAYYSFSVRETDYLEQYEDMDKVNARAFDTQDAAVSAASQDEKDFFRYSHYAANNNSTLASGLHSLQYYWSLSNPAIVASNNELGILGRTHNNYLDLNSRAGLTALANVKYFADNEGKGIQYAPYGYQYRGAYPVSSTGGVNWDIYENTCFLPFGYTYSSVLDPEYFAGLTSVQKEEAMLQGACVEGGTDLPKKEPMLDDREIPYEIVCDSKKVTCQGNSFVAVDAKTTVTLTFEKVSGCELYLLVDGLSYEGCSPIELYQDESRFDPLNVYKQRTWDKMSKLQKEKLLYKNRNWSQKSELELLVSAADAQGNSVVQQMYHFTPDYTWYSGKENYTVHLGYSQADRTSISIVLPEAGIYSFRDLRVVCNPLDGFEDQIEELQKDRLENVSFGSDSVTGEIDLESPKLLCVTIPYAKGWRAYVDGEEAQIRQTNLMYMGLELKAGYHDIVFRYRTPGLRAGQIIALFGVLAAAAAALIWKKSIARIREK